MYSFFFYGLLSLLLLPLAGILQIFGGFDYTNSLDITIALRYTQLVLILLICFTAYLVYKLSKHLGYRDGTAKWAAYLYMASPLTIFADAVFWQYDVVTLVFFIIALGFYINHDLTKFSLIMAIAITCKMFALFAFIPLILFAEKRVVHIIKHLAIGVSLTAVSELVAHKMKGYGVAKALRSHLTDKLTDNGIAYSFGYVSLSLIALAGIAIYAYMITAKSEADFKHQSLYITFISLAAPFALFFANTYWWILVVPFGAILIAGHPKVKELMVLVSGFFVFLIITSVLVFKYYMDQDMVNGGLFAKVFGVRYSGKPSFYSLAESRNIADPNVFYAFALALLFAVFVILWKKTGHELFLAPKEIPAVSDHPQELSATDSPEQSATAYQTVVKLIPDSAVYLYNLAIYTYILPSLLLFTRELLLK
ncbi:hypothetical protein [Arcanobacterium ihumii]|uniref:hypothetical protein n=1 Tax=Arcanobacterium ihumii TaxID=2138162 RepID=UPI000F525DE7|nr:hypothetical protein [Arcanobacterium ihumii]